MSYKDHPDHETYVVSEPEFVGEFPVREDIPVQKGWEVRHGDCLEVLKSMPDASIDSIITDPPYGLSTFTAEEVRAALTAWLSGHPYVPKGRGFMGARWDAFVPGPEVWRECFRVLKPGGHLLAFAGARTQDLMGISIRLAGFDMRDAIRVEGLLAWVTGQGFPKSLSVHKATLEAVGSRYGTARCNCLEFNDGCDPRDDVGRQGGAEASDPRAVRSPPESPTGDSIFPVDHGSGDRPVRRMWETGEEEAARCAPGEKALLHPGVCRRGAEEKRFGDASLRGGLEERQGEDQGSGQEVRELRGGPRPENSARPSPEAVPLRGEQPPEESGEPLRLVPPHDRSSNDDRLGVDPDRSQARRAHPDDRGGRGSAVARICSWCGLPDREWLKSLRPLGTALKPAYEPILVFRKPLEGTVVQNVIAHGTGALNIDACRIGVQDEDYAKNACGERGHADNRKRRSDFHMGGGSAHAQGRWPTNVAFVHTPDCKRVGSKEVAGRVINRFDDGMKPFGDGAGHPYTSTETPPEMISEFECVTPSSYTVEVFDIDGIMVVPASDPFHSLFEMMDRICSSLLLLPSENRSGDTENMRWNEPDNALPKSSLPNWMGGCPACSHFYGEQLPQVVEAARASPRQLADALGHAHDLARSLVHTQTHPLYDPQSKVGVSPEKDTNGSTFPSRTSAGTPRFSEQAETSSCTSGKGSEQQLPDVTPSNTVVNRTSEDGRQGSPSSCHISCKGRGLRLFVREVLLAACQHLPIKVVSETVRRHGCPVAALDGQTGELKSGTMKAGTTRKASKGKGGYQDGFPDEATSHDTPGDSGGASRFFPQFEYADEDSPLSWECAPGCPIAALDDQTGELKSGRLDQASVKAENHIYGKHEGYNDPKVYEPDSGGASRFFPQFGYTADDAPFRYMGKVTRKERNEGLEEFEAKQMDLQRDADAPGANNPRNRGGRADPNPHPCVKPISLLRWLAKLVTPPDGVILDPFSGSGSMGCAAVLEGFHYLGIEREPEYVAISRARIVHHHAKARGGVKNPWTAPPPKVQPETDRLEPTSIEDIFGFGE